MKCPHCQSTLLWSDDRGAHCDGCEDFDPETDLPPTIEAKAFPTEFRGCQWNDGWEFDAPCVIYYPPAYRCFGIGGNTGHLDSMVEDICMNLSLKWDHNDGGLDRECEWRGWSKRGFARRRAARHVIFKVKWQHGPDGPEWTVVDRKETYGLPKPNPELGRPAERDRP